jgi:hypothetical protein
MIKKIVYGSVLGVMGTEVIMVGAKFYEMYKTGSAICIAGGNLVAPHWLLIEGTMIGIAPIITRCIIRAKKDHEIADDSNLINLFKKLNKKKGAE